MYEKSCGHSPRCERFTFAIVAAISVFLSIGSASAIDDCADPQQYRASDFEALSGFSRAALNKQGNLVVTLDQTADKMVDRIYRVHLTDPRHRKQALSRWSGGEVELRVNTWTVDDQNIHQFLPVQSGNSFVVAFKGHKCLDEFVASQKMSRAPVYLRTGISIHIPAALESKWHDSVLESYDEQGIFRTAPASSETSRDPLICVAGGEGATGCSINFGGIGGLTSGSCSVSGCEAPSFACCGPGFLSNCTCRSPDDGGGSGGGIGGDPGGGAGGDPGGNTGGGEGGDDDECDQSDPPDSCDDSEGDKDEIGA